MKKIAAMFALIGAIVVLVGIFQPWLYYDYESDFGIYSSVSGWTVFHNSGSERLLFQMGMSPLSGETHALIVFIAAIVMMACALPAVFLSFKDKIGSAAVQPFGIIISLAAVAAIGGLIWFLIDMGGTRDGWHIGDGVYVCGLGALLGLFCGSLASSHGSE